MQSSAYNNPLFAQGLAQLVQGFIGNPQQTAQNEEAASRALLNNQTAQYREAIGDTGLNGDLASMMIRALQAGPEYSGNAPKIGDSAIKMGALGFGSPALTPDGDIAGMIRSAMMPSRGRSGGGGGSSGGGAGTTAPKKLTDGSLSRLARMVRDGGYEGPEGARVQSAIIDAYQGGGFATLDQAAASILPSVGYEDVVVGQDPNDSWYNPMDWIRGPSDITEKQLKIPSAAPAAPAGGADEITVLNGAREAIASGKDEAAVRARVAEMGFDPSKI